MRLFGQLIRDFVQPRRGFVTQLLDVQVVGVRGAELTPEGRRDQAFEDALAVIEVMLGAIADRGGARR